MPSDYSHLGRLLACPVCGEQFVLFGKTLKCANRHTFDIARQGYVNFVDGKGKSPGDTRPMLEARRNFLNGGFYEPLSQAINRLVRGYLEARPEPVNSPALIVEAGCGEGYYLGRLARQLAEPDRYDFLGWDISKEAVKMAVRQHPEAGYVVANTNRRLPLGDKRVSVLLNIFAPRNAAEFSRVLTPDGLLLVVMPTETHLNNLRLRFGLLPMEQDKQNKVIAHFAPYFTLANQETLRYTLNLTQTALWDLVIMTPNYWFLSEEKKQAVRSLECLRVEVGFEVLSFSISS